MEKNKTNGKVSQGGAETEETPAPSQTTVSESGKLSENGTKPTMTVEEKIRKVNSLSDLIDKRFVLRNHLERVENLKFGDFDEEKDVISIISSDNQMYQIKSASLCRKIATLLKDEISGKIAEVEAEIIF